MRIQLQDPTNAKAAVDAVNAAQRGMYGRLVQVDGVSLQSPNHEANPELGIELGLLIEAADIVPTEVFGESLAQFSVWGSNTMFTITVALDVEVLVGHVAY